MLQASFIRCCCTAESLSLPPDSVNQNSCCWNPESVLICQRFSCPFLVCFPSEWFFIFTLTLSILIIHGLHTQEIKGQGGMLQGLLLLLMNVSFCPYWEDLCQRQMLQPRQIHGALCNVRVRAHRLISPSLPDPAAAIRLHPPCTVAFSIIPLMGLMIFPLLKHESNIQITLEGTRKKLWFYLTPVTSLTENQWYLSQRQEKQIPCGGVIHLSRQYIWWFIAALPRLKTLSICPHDLLWRRGQNPYF